MLTDASTVSVILFVVVQDAQGNVFYLRFDPDSTVPVSAGSFVTHYGRGIHYDGAKAEPCELLIVGQGPGTSTPAEIR